MSHFLRINVIYCCVSFMMRNPAAKFHLMVGLVWPHACRPLLLERFCLLQQSSCKLLGYWHRLTRKILAQGVFSFYFEHAETNERFCYKQTNTPLERQDMTTQQWLLISSRVRVKHTAWTPLLVLPSKCHHLSFSRNALLIHEQLVGKKDVRLYASKEWHAPSPTQGGY